MTQNPKQKRDKQINFITLKIKSLYMAKDILSKVDRQIANWGNSYN